MNSDRVKLIVDSIQYDLGFIQGRGDLGYPISKQENFSPKPHNSNKIATTNIPSFELLQGYFCSHFFW